VLVSNTAIPVWQASRRWLPVLFAASSTATAGSIIDILYHREAGRNVGRIFGTAGRVMEIAATIQVERAACAIPQVGRPMRHGAPALLWKAATALTVSSLTLSLLPFKSRKKSVAAGLLGVAGSLCLRFAVHYIGDASARDPRAAFQQQRA
jgi:formate-dependent nitrite reductase membrane component NrfD